MFTQNGKGTNIMSHLLLILPENVIEGLLHEKMLFVCVISQRKFIQLLQQYSLGL